MISLAPRLSAVASLIRGGGVVADIGTDHAYLPVYLVESGAVKSAIAADVRKGPLFNAQKTVEASALSDKISLRLSDGLCAFSPDDADEFVFAGMGGTLICELLEKAPWVKNEKYHFVFQPQSRAEELREYLFKNGFSLGKELVVREGERVYICFECGYTGTAVSYSEADTFLGKLPQNDCAREHIRRQYLRLLKKYEALQATDDEKQTQKLQVLLNSLKEFFDV